MDEAGFIAALRAFATHPAARGLADDAAVLEVADASLVITHDMIAEGTHFLPGMDPADIAWRLVATNMSDLAAKGARPLGVLLGHMLGDGDQAFVEALRDALAEYGAPLLGGDTIRGQPGAPRAYGLTALGLATHRPVPSRAGARPGDGVWLAGPVGAAMLGYEALRKGLGRSGSTDAAVTLAYRRPRARLAQGIALAPLVTAMMDVSDGLLLDGARLARASGVTLAIESAAVPIAAPEARRADALRWGDDYALLFTAPETMLLPEAVLPTEAVRIGSVLVAGAAPLILDGTPLTEADRLGYRH